VCRSYRFPTLHPIKPLPPAVITRTAPALSTHEILNHPGSGSGRLIGFKCLHLQPTNIKKDVKIRKKIKFSRKMLKEVIGGIIAPWLFSFSHPQRLANYPR
jgi:hypothetical protein